MKLVMISAVLIALAAPVVAETTSANKYTHGEKYSCKFPNKKNWFICGPKDPRPPKYCTLCQKPQPKPPFHKPIPMK